MKKILLGTTAIMALAAHYTDAIAGVSWNSCPVTPGGQQCIQNAHVNVTADPLTVNRGQGEVWYDIYVEAMYICNLDINIGAETVETKPTRTGGKTKDGRYYERLHYRKDVTEPNVVLTCPKGTPATLPLADKIILDKIGWVPPEAAPAPANLPKFDQGALELVCEQSLFKASVWKEGEKEKLRESVRKEKIGTWSLPDLQATASSLQGIIASAVFDDPNNDRDKYLLCMIKARIQQLESPPPNATDLNRKALLQSLPRRGDGDGTARLKESVALAAEDPATKAARAREKEEQRGRDEAALSRANANYIQGVVTATASQIEQAQKTSGTNGSSGSPSPSLSATSQQQQQQAPSQAQSGDSKYYPSLPCASLSQEKYSDGTPHTVIVNLCNQSIEAHYSGGMVNLGPGASYPVSSGTTVYGACNVPDFLDRSSGQCKL